MDIIIKNLSENNLKNINLLIPKNKLVVFTGVSGSGKSSVVFDTIASEAQRQLYEISNMGKGIKEKAKKIIMKKFCPCCHGQRLNRRALECKISGYSISDLCEMEVIKLQSILSQFSIYDSTQQLIETLTNRLQQLINVGLDYVTLNRSVNTLSGGEAQRLKIVKLAGNALTDIMYIFDEPSSGMHPHDVKKICDLMQMLRDKGNSIIVVEHNKQIIEIADYIIELGPGAGKNGGNVIFKGSYEKLISSNTITAQSLKRKITFKSIQRKPKKFYEIHNANINNLKNINTTIPLGVLVMVTGVAGSGKSSLFTQCFYEQLEKDGVLISQKSIVGMNKSNTATYMGLFGLIRQLFAEISNKDESVFSFNSKGACPVCAGKGYISSGLTIYQDIYFEETQFIWLHD